MYIRDKEIRGMVTFLLLVLDALFLYFVVMSFGGMWRLSEYQQATWIIKPSSALFLSLIGFIGLLVFTVKTIGKN